MVGGYWHSERCESCIGGIWSKRQFQMYSGDKLWTGRWDYYNDSQCRNYMYTITAAGNYMQRAAKREYYRKMVKREMFLDYNGPRKDVTKYTTESRKVKRQKRSMTDGVDQYLRNLQFSTMDEWRIAAMLRSRRTSSDETTTEMPSTWNVPSGITELDLYVVESSLIPQNAAMFAYCNSDKPFGVPPNIWKEHCIPHSIEVPSILRLRAKVIVNWNGQYVLLLSGQDDYVWEAPLRQCAVTPPHNPELQMQLHKSFTLRFGLVPSTAMTIGRRFFHTWFYLLQFLLFYVYYLARWYLARLWVAIFKSSRNF